MEKRNDMREEICRYIGNMYHFALKGLDSVNSEFVLQPLNTLKESKVLVRVDPNISGAAEIRYNRSENTFYIGFQSDEVLQTHHEGVGDKETIVRVLVDACNSNNVVKAWFMGLGNQPLSRTEFPTYEQITSVKQPGWLREKIKFTEVPPPPVVPEPPDGFEEPPKEDPLEP